MTALAKRILGMMKTISNGLPQQLWRWSASSGWALSASDTIIRHTGASGQWHPIIPSVKKRNVAGGGKYYFEVKINDDVLIVDSTCIRIGVVEGTTHYVFTGNGSVPVGNFPHGSSSYIDWRLYTDSTRQPASVYRWSKGDTIGCSIEKIGSDTALRFYINGINPSYNGQPILITGTPDLAIGGSGWRVSPTDAIELQIMDLKHLPLGFEPW